MPERFIVLRGTHAGPVYLVRPDCPDDADTWTSERDEAWRFSDRAHADVVRETIVESNMAAAVVPATIPC